MHNGPANNFPARCIRFICITPPLTVWQHAVLPPTGTAVAYVFISYRRAEERGKCEACALRCSKQMQWSLPFFDLYNLFMAISQMTVFCVSDTDNMPKYDFPLILFNVLLFE